MHHHERHQRPQSARSAPSPRAQPMNSSSRHLSPDPPSRRMPYPSSSASIRLIDLTTGKVARKFSGGHAGAVRLLSFSPDGRYLASSASSARFVNVFDVAGEVPSAEPVATLGFAAIPTFLALHATVGGEEGDRITAIAGFDVGGVSVLRTRRRADGKGEFIRGRWAEEGGICRWRRGEEVTSRFSLEFREVGHVLRLVESFFA